MAAEIFEREGHGNVGDDAGAFQAIALGGENVELADVEFASALNAVSDAGQHAAAGLASDDGGAAVFLHAGGEKFGVATGTFVDQDHHWPRIDLPAGMADVKV